MSTKKSQSVTGTYGFGEKQPSDAALDNLYQEVEKLSEGDRKVSLVMVDLRSKSGVAYNFLQPMCSQSTIKAVYIGSVLDDDPEALKENGAYMREAIEFSANEPYHNLREIYETEPLAKWCREVGVDEGFTEPLKRDNAFSDTKAHPKPRLTISCRVVSLSCIRVNAVGFYWFVL